jgi:Zn-dependent protease with chaperone function
MPARRGAATAEHPVYPGLSPRAYEHPADRAATAALQRIPLLDRVLRMLASVRSERMVRMHLLGNAVRIGDDQVPDVAAAHRGAFATLDCEPVPSLYVTQNPWANAMTFGIDEPIVILRSALLTTLDRPQLRAVLAHEAAHVQCGHLLYRTSLVVLLRTTLSQLPPLGSAVRRALILALNEWSRTAELSCDRASVLAVRDPVVVCSALMNLTAGDVPGLSVDAFIRQSEEYRDWGGLWDRTLRFFDELDSTYPWSVRRVTELTAWVRSGDYDRIVDGDYVRRGAEPPVTAEMQGLIEHYRQRFADILEEAGVGARQLTSRLRSWLKAVGDAVGGADDEDGSQP